MHRKYVSWSGKWPSDYKMTVQFVREGRFAMHCCLGITADCWDNEAVFGEEIREIFKKNFYVDDSLFSKPSTEQAVHSSLELMRMLRKGNFRPTKFHPAEERTIKNLDLDKLPIERALGQQWNIDFSLQDRIVLLIDLPQLHMYAQFYRMKLIKN